MKSLIVWLLGFVIITGTCIAQDVAPLAAYKADGLWHVIGSDSKELFMAIKAEEIKSYGDGLIAIQKEVNYEKKWGYIDLKGNIIIEPQFDKASPFINGKAIVLKYTDDSKSDMISGMIDKTGKLIMPMDYIEILDNSEGLTYIMNPKERGYIDETGKMILTLTDYAGYSYSEGLAAVVNREMKFGYIDKAGKLVIPMKYNDAGPFTEGLAYVYSGGSYGYNDKTGKMIIPPIFDYAKSFKDSRAIVGKLYAKNFQTEWGIIDKNGISLTGFKYNEVSDFSEGLLAVFIDKKIRYLRMFLMFKNTPIIALNDNKWGFVDKDGKQVIEQKYTKCGDFVNGLAWAYIAEENKYGFINKKGDWVIVLPKAEKVVDLRLNKVVY